MYPHHTLSLSGFPVLFFYPLQNAIYSIFPVMHNLYTTHSKPLYQLLLIFNFRYSHIMTLAWCERTSKASKNRNLGCLYNVSNYSEVKRNPSTVRMFSDKLRKVRIFRIELNLINTYKNVINNKIIIGWCCDIRQW